jgi:putative ABC transport system permease protein
MEEPDTAVVASYLVPTKSDFSFSSYTPPVTLEGFWLQDDSLPEVYLSMASSAGGAPRRLRVIGVLDSMAVYLGEVVTSRDTLEAVAGEELPTFAYMIGLAPGVDPAPAARALEKAFVSNGLQAEPVGAEIREMTRSSLMVNTLLQWFMALGLVVGIAALGVIAARSVVERRRQIGVLRALGFQPAMVQLAFLLESTFVSVLGIGLGVLLAVALSPGVTEGMSAEFEGMTYTVPVTQIVLISVVAYVASLLTTYLPSRQASKVYPAEALRYE